MRYAALLFCLILPGVGCAAQPTLPGPQTEIGQRAKSCGAPRICGKLGFVDCGQAMDRPAYYFVRKTGKIVSVCGGACMRDPTGQCRKRCPPPEWTSAGCGSAP